MTIKLRLSSRDGRAREVGASYSLHGRDDNSLVSTHSSHASGLRAMVCLQQVSGASAAWGFSAAQLHEIIGDVCERQLGTRDYDTLYGAKQAQLIRAVQIELRSRQRR